MTTPTADVQPPALQEPEQVGAAARPEPVPAWKRVSRPTIALSAAIVALLAVAGVLGGLLAGANSRADVLTAKSAAAAASASAAQDSLSSAEAAQHAAEVRASAAEAAASSAQQAAQDAQAAQQSASSGAADDNYLAILRSEDPAFLSVPDPVLTNIGHVTCQYFQLNGNGDAAVIHVMDNATSHGLTAHQGATVIVAATNAYCPQYKVAGN